MKYKDNWEETQERFIAWWNRSCVGRPLMKVVAKREKPIGDPEKEIPFLTPEDMYINVEENIKRFRNYNLKYSMLAEAFPHFSMNFGPGSLALYLGSQPVFAWDTVWFTDNAKDGWSKISDLRFNPDNPIWIRHLEIINKARELSKDDFLIDIPDLVEGIDILAAMRGPFQFCYDLIDIPDIIKKYMDQLDELYFKFFDPMYNSVKLENQSCSYTAFDIWGPGKTAKVQCDFCAMMSPDQFREFVQPYLEKQCNLLDHSLYHLDGPDCIKHIDALMEIKSLDALQWTPGAGNPDGGHELWYPIYDKVKHADKSLWISLYDDDLRNCVENAEKLVKRYGSDGLYLLFPTMSENDAKELIKKAEQKWK